MGWSEIKHAINSSVGTENFKPLNEIVEDAFNTIIGEQNSMRQKLSTGENDFIVSKAKSVETNVFWDILKNYNAARISYGFYTGTGSYGENNPNTLILPFAPKFVLISCFNNGNLGIITLPQDGENGDGIFWASGAPYVNVGYRTSDCWACNVLKTENTNEVSWWAYYHSDHEQSMLQFNYRGFKYRYMAFG